ncbi:MAG: hypothetical protein ABI672_01675 [Vicinamibacteria bacterium]
MNDWGIFFLGVMALCAVVQCAFVVIMALGLKKSGERVNDLYLRFDRDVKPAIDDLRQGAANLRAITESGREQALRIESLLTTTLGNLETSIESVRALVMKPVASLTDLSALWGGLRRGLDTYRTSAPKRRSPPSPVRRSAEDSDEHLFIG